MAIRSCKVGPFEAGCDDVADAEADVSDPDS
jgi:hypothetical protein